MHFSPQISILDCETNQRVSLEQKSYIKYLGVLIDQNLSWKNHVDSVIVKISKTIGMIAKLRYFVPSTGLVNIYNSLILPYITYGLLAWGNASNAYLNKILVLQKRVLRLIYFTDRREHAIPLFTKAKVLPVTFLYYEAVSKLMFDVHNQSAPINILKLFTKTSQIHTYNTRSSKSQLFSTKHSRLNLQKKAFSRVGVKVWNKIPKEFKTLSKDSFNKQMKKSLFQILDNEDSYLDVENISSKLKDCIIKSN